MIEFDLISFLPGQSFLQLHFVTFTSHTLGILLASFVKRQEGMGEGTYRASALRPSNSDLATYYLCNPKIFN